MAIANRFFPTMSQARGDRNLFSPTTEQTFQHSQVSFVYIVKTIQTKCMTGGCKGLLVLTESLQSISHGLILHHVDQSSTQAEVREDEEHILQDVIDTTNLLEKESSHC